jgi:hypothetical protein
MLIVMGDKQIYFVRCSFCRQLCLPDGYHCALGLPLCDTCPQFTPVADVGARVSDVFRLLPDKAGKDIDDT